MKQIKYILIFTLALFMSIPAFANKDLKAVTDAEKAYASKHYKEAITCYNSILEQGFVSYKLYYNLGNSYYKNNEIGKAIYNYELANKLKPNNEDIKTNLRIANEKTIDDIESKENFFLSALKSGLVNSLSTTGWAWLSILTLVGCLGFAFMYLIGKQIAFKRIGFFMSALSLLSFAISMVLGFTAFNAKQQIKFAVITAKETKIQTEPDRSSPSKFNLHEGTKVRVLETNAEWTNIRLENGNEGWVQTADAGLF
jgi:tetratricopeptide (TPR) repeat protein